MDRRSGGQWKCIEPPINPGASWGEVVDKSNDLETPYRGAIHSDSILNLGQLRPNEIQGDESMQKWGGSKHDKRCVSPGNSIRSWTIGRVQTESFVIHNGARCNNIADDLEEAYPEIVDGQMADIILTLLIAFNGSDKNITSRSRSRSSLRPGEFHGKTTKYPDEPELKKQLQGAMRLAGRARMFRHVSVSCAANGATWSIDTNSNIDGFDNGKAWDNWTKIALQAL